MKIKKEEKIRIGISACLLGERTRYNGEEKPDHFLKYTLGRYFEWVPVCPEVECGMPVPREPMQLVGDPTSPELITKKTKINKTPIMRKWLKKKVIELKETGASGFILKSRSPSCGLKTNVYCRKKESVKRGKGIFAATLIKEFPHMPVAEDEDLWQPEERESFIEQIFSYKSWQELIRKAKTRKILLEFHTEHKLHLMAHSRRHLQELGRLIADTRAFKPRELYQRYFSLYMDAHKFKATRKKHTNVLQHILGYFKRHLHLDEKRQILQTIEDYRLGRIPLIVPVAILSHYANKFDVEYLKRQFYLNLFKLSLF